MLAGLRRTEDTTRWLLAAAVLVVAAGLPLLLSGPGNDLDVANIFRSGRSIALHADYVPSRAPGAPVHEAFVGIADRIGGPVATNLLSLAAAAILVVSLDRLLAGEGLGPRRRWAIAVLVANPWFVIAATSTIDHVFAMAFVVLSAHLLRSGRLVWAGVAGALAMGSRVGSVALLAAMLLAELGGPTVVTGADAGSQGDDDDGDDRDGADGAGHADEVASGSGGAVDRLRSVLVVGAIVSVGTVVLFIPSFIHAGGFSFAENDFSRPGAMNLLGRAAVKDLTLLGPIASVVALAAVPAVITALRGWRTSWPVRFAVPAFVLSQIMFIRFPWKMGHLLPCLLALVVLLAVALDDRGPRLLRVLVALQLVYCVVAVQVVEPDRANDATSARPTLSIGAGPVVTDLRCRHDHPDPHQGRQKVEVEAAWVCSQPFGDAPG